MVYDQAVTVGRRAGELTAVWVPDETHEAMPDLLRSWATAVRVTGQARHHLQGSAPAWPSIPRQKGLDESLWALAVDPPV